MAYLRRKLDDYLREWRAAEERYPLIVRGARQVGKTASILEFARQNYEHVVYSNFAHGKWPMCLIESACWPQKISTSCTLT